MWPPSIRQGRSFCHGSVLFGDRTLVGVDLGIAFASEKGGYFLGTFLACGFGGREKGELLQKEGNTKTRQQPGIRIEISLTALKLLQIVVRVSVTGRKCNVELGSLFPKNEDFVCHLPW